ncbi:N-acetylmuramoyl-L-alanine amidase [Clostridium paraputrificum]|uniref:N-acetylmuramoyl-L-alanine amidase n=1 Tax=Clostridium paraputrificum TaxID=29363 RepID=UPI003D340D4E
MRIKRLLCALIIALLSFTTPVIAEENKGIILIDAGHGGIDGGAKSKNGTVEKEINLIISQKLKKRLESDGYTVYMTRDEDTQLSKKKVEDLNLRCKLKKETKCDAFISIHQNKFGKENCFGAQVWYSNNDKSAKIANLIQDGLKEKVDDNNKRLAKSAKEQYRILRDGYEGASIIVECGFISNNAEEERLKTDIHQNKIVEGISCGINKYFDENK